MQTSAETLLVSWNSFYVIIGSSSAALTGLMFIVVSLTPEARLRTSEGVLTAFATPTIVHLSMGLLVSVLLSAPWPTLAQAGVAAGVCGIAGLAYCVIVVARIMRTNTQTGYKPVLEDWLWHTVFPIAAYVAVAVAGLMLADHPRHAPFGVAGATILLLFIGIHNAWDSVTYIAIERAKAARHTKR